MKLFSLISAILGCAALPLFSYAQLVRGLVIDKISRDPIAGVCLRCYPDSVYCFSDSLGFFALEGITHSRIDIEAQCNGYDDALLSQILTSSSKDLAVTIELKEKINGLGEVIVTARHPKMLPQNEMSVTSSRSFSVEECRRYAGGLDDPARMATNFAGCAAVQPGTNALIVRGNSPSSVSWRLEGVDIPSPVHFNGSGDLPGGGFYTIFSGFMLANSDFYSSCFPAEYYNAVGGIFDVRFRSGNPRKHEFSTQIGVQGFDLSAEGPLIRSNGPTFICNARLSTMQLLTKIIPELSDQSISYQDYSAKIDIPDTKIGRISIWGISGSSKMNNYGVSDPDESTDLSMKNLMFASGITNEYSINNKISMRNVVAVTRDCQNLNLSNRHPERPATPTSDYGYDGKCTNLVASSTLSQKLSNRTIGRYGVTYRHIWDDCRSQIGTDATNPFCNYSSMADIIQGHGQIKHEISSKTAAVLGGSITYFSLAKECAAEPRLGVEYKPKQNHSFAIGAGLHSQIAPLYIYRIDTDEANENSVMSNQTLKMMRSFHLTGSYNLIVSPVCRLKIEPYLQYLYHVPVLENSTFSIINMGTLPEPSISENRFVNDGAGLNTGIDFTYERFISKGYYYMGTMSLFKSTYRDFFGAWHPTRFDTRWNINVLGGKEFTFRRKNGLYKILGLNAHISLSGHEPYSPIDYEQSHYYQSIVYDETNPYSFRKKGVNILSDISLTYMVNYKSFTGTIALQVKNIFGEQYLGQIYNLSKGMIEDYYFRSSIPLLSYKIEF